MREKPQLKKSLEDFTQIVQQRAPRMRRSALGLVEQYVSRLSAIGFHSEMAAVQKTVAGVCRASFYLLGHLPLTPSPQIFWVTA